MRWCHPAERLSRPRVERAGDDIELSLIEAERDLVNDLYRAGELKDEGRRHIERELDLEEASIACKREGGEEPPL